MRTEPRYLRAISLTEQEDRQVSYLQKQGIKVIEIFRQGLALVLKIKKTVNPKR